MSDEPGVLALVVPLVARLAGHPEMLHEVTRAARTLQSSDDSDVWVPFVARVLEAAILGVPLQDAVSTNLPRLPQPQRASVESAVNAGVEEALAASRAGTAGGEAMGDESLATAQRLGLACPLGQTIPTAIVSDRAGSANGSINIEAPVCALPPALLQLVLQYITLHMR